MPVQKSAVSQEGVRKWPGAPGTKQPAQSVAGPSTQIQVLCTEPQAVLHRGNHSGMWWWGPAGRFPFSGAGFWSCTAIKVLCFEPLLLEVYFSAVQSRESSVLLPTGLSCSGGDTDVLDDR